MGFKLGRLATPKDTLEELARRPGLSQYLASSDGKQVMKTIQEIPPSCDRSKIGVKWGYLLNDELSNCALAAAGHADMIADHYFNPDVPPMPDADDKIREVYMDLAHHDPDAGTDPIEVLRYWQDNIVGDQQAKYFHPLDIRQPDHRDIKAAVYLLGFAYIALWLPVEICHAADKKDYGEPWDRVTESCRPDEGNGHCAIVAGYDEQNATVITWGRPVTASWDFLDEYCDQAYGVILPNWVTGNPLHLTLAKLEADLKKL